MVKWQLDKEIEIENWIRPDISPGSSIERSIESSIERNMENMKKGRIYYRA